MRRPAGRRRGRKRRRRRVKSALVEVKVVKVMKVWQERLGLSYICYALEYVEASFRRTKRLTRGSKNSNQD
jgi:hypothetical protein